MTEAPFTLALHHTPGRRALAPMAVGVPGVRRILLEARRVGYRFAGLDEVGPDGAPARTVTLTVDDGYASNLLHLAPLLRELGIPWAVFVSVRTLGATNRWDLGWVGQRERHLSAEEVRALAAEGVTVGSHGMRHESMTRLDDRALDDSLGGSRRRLEDLTGRPVDAIAYPWGRVDERVARAAARAGYRLGFAVESPRPLAPELRRLALPRVALYAPDQIPGLFRATGPWAPRPLHGLRSGLTLLGGTLVGLALSARDLRRA
ncbi:MAG TPA: polysaccharide deacetylase family protein [Candidatus Eisenbacteria bacterium]